MPNEVTPVTPENLQEAISRLRNEFVEDRVERAARMMESLRNFMMVYTAFLTLVLAVFAVLGIKSWSDIDNNRIKVEAATTQAETAA
jgi:cell division septal protein FtsQ